MHVLDLFAETSLEEEAAFLAKQSMKEAGKGAISADDIRSVLWKLFQQDAVMPAQGDNPELGLGDEEYSAFEEHAENILKFAQQHNITDAKEAVISYLTSKMRELQAQGSMPSGGSLHESRKLFAKIKETADVTDYNPPSQGGTRQELVAKYHQTKDPKDAEAARRAGATQQELQGVAEEGYRSRHAWLNHGVTTKWPSAKIRRVKINGQRIDQALVHNVVVGEWNLASKTGFVNSPANTPELAEGEGMSLQDRKSTRLNSSH